MRKLLSLMLLLLSFPSAAHAADELLFGPAPAWVVPVAMPATPAKSGEAPIRVLLNDEQIWVERGRSSKYSRLALALVTAQGLAAGNVAFAWNPQTDTITVHKLEIRRGPTVIDVLKSGQTFTIVRREANLESATLDGNLTASIQPEGLEVGDIVELAMTVTHVDPVLGDHFEAAAASWNGVTVDRGHSRVTWPADKAVRMRPSGGLALPATVTRDGMRGFSVTIDNIEPIVVPQDAPARFQVGRGIELTDFASWAELAAVMAPLYRDASVIQPNSALRIEADKIAATTKDPARRAELALQLAQDRVRYVALLMGQGSYVPASAELTWSRRFGDCKAKTALLLAFLHHLGIDAEPVLVNTASSDGFDQRLPMLGLFNHVMVRARIKGRDYWLDGTRQGDTSLQRLQPPNTHFVLPAVANASLVKVERPRLLEPEMDMKARIDATAGLLRPAPTHLEAVIRGDGAIAINSIMAIASPDQKTKFLSELWKEYFRDLSVSSANASFDKDSGELHLTADGSIKMDWSRNRYWLSNAGIGYEPDFDRPAGPMRDLPFAISHPDFTRTEQTIVLPDGFEDRSSGPLDEMHSLGGYEFKRTAKYKGNIFHVVTSRRSLTDELSSAQARADAPKLKALANKDLSIPVAAGYALEDKEYAASLSAPPENASQAVSRATLMLEMGRADEALALFDEALRQEPQNSMALVGRASAHLIKGNFAAATSDINAAKAIAPDREYVWQGLGTLAGINGDYRLAIEHYSRALTIRPDSFLALYGRAQAHSATGDYVRALTDFEAALALAPGRADLRLARANLYLRQNKPDLALGEADELVRRNSDQSFALVAAAKIYSRFGRRDTAIKTIDRALAIKPEAYIYLNRAEVREESDTKGRMADYDAALSLDPSMPEALVAKAEALIRGGDEKGAIALYDKAIAVGVPVSNVGVERALLLNKLGRSKESGEALAVVRAQAKTADDFNSICWALATAGVFLEDARRDCDKGIALEPDSFAIIDSLGLVLLRQGKFDEAIAAYDRAIAKNNNPTSRMGRSLAWAAKGDSLRAKADRDAANVLDRSIEDRFAEYGLKFE